MKKRPTINQERQLKRLHKVIYEIGEAIEYSGAMLAEMHNALVKEKVYPEYQMMLYSTNVLVMHGRAELQSLHGKVKRCLAKLVAPPRPHLKRMRDRRKQTEVKSAA